MSIIIWSICLFQVVKKISPKICVNINQSDRKYTDKTFILIYPTTLLPCSLAPIFIYCFFLVLFSIDYILEYSIWFSYITGKYTVLLMTRKPNE